MKQVLGDKKLKLCGQITGRSYLRGYTRGGWTHGTAQCWFGDGVTLYNADFVNYLTGESRPHIRDGQLVKVQATA